MDGTDLTFEDNSFDIVYSYSSIEHFGSKEAAEKCMREVARVLKPGGMASIATELILGVYHDLKWEFLKSIQNMLSSHWLEPELFTLEQLNLLIARSGLKPTNPLHLSVDNIDPLYGGIYMKGRGFYWTSVHLCLVKPE